MSTKTKPIKPVKAFDPIAGQDLNHIYYSYTLDEAWEYWFDLLSNQGQQAKSRDGDVVGEVINAITVLNNPTQNVMKSSIRNLNMRYGIGELLWYFSANNDLKEIQKYTKAWDRMSDDGYTVNSNYGHKIRKFWDFDQWDFVKQTLRDNPESRQAVIHIKNPSPAPSKDVCCTIALQYFIRNNKLFATTNMRSNDIWMGFPYDVFTFTCLQVLLSMELGVELGTYTHLSGSLHLYERDYQKVITP